MSDLEVEIESTSQAEEEVPPVTPDDESEVPVLALWSSDAELDLTDARQLTSTRGAHLAMFLGESDVGKTTLLVELWTDLLLKGHLGDLRFGGSATAIPFEERAFQSRMESGVLEGYTLKTYEENDGFLHLRVGRLDGSAVELLFSDFAGEHFLRVREGVPIEDELPWTRRVDKFGVVLDGRACVTPGEREVAVNRTQRLLLALQASDAVHPTSTLRLIVAKDDEARDDEKRALLEESVDRLLEVARAVDASCEAIRVAARPAIGVPPYGLDGLLEWLSEPVPALPSSEPVVPALLRALARFA